MAKRSLATLPNLTEDVARLVDDFQKETDRGVALLGAAFLDDVIEVMLRAFFVDDKEAANRLISPGRPLESFGSRTHLAYLVGLLGCDVYRDINLIREIRNDFAHRQPASFNQADVAAKCQRLQAVRVMYPDDSCSPRDRFIVTVVLLANHLMILTESLHHTQPAKDFSQSGVLRLR